MKYAIIDYINNQELRFENEIEFGFTLDEIFEKFEQYEICYFVRRYNNGKVVVIK